MEEAGSQARGFRFDLPDGDLIWRTEGVVRRAEGRAGHVLRLRVLCQAAEGLAPLDDPKRPYLIKTLIGEGRVHPDGQLPVIYRAHRLPAGDEGLALAAAITEGTASRDLPVVYLSAREEGPVIDEGAADRLANQLAGIAHVVLEPYRAFSLALRDRTDGRNVYGGTAGISVPGEGIVERAWLGWRFATPRDMADHLRRAAMRLRGQMASQGGWDWARLQEAHARDLRRRERNRLSERELEALYEDELAAKDQRIAELERELAGLAADRSPGRQEAPSEAILDDAFIEAVGPELWEGEHADRVLAALGLALAYGQVHGLDDRTRAVLERMQDLAQYSGRASAIAADLKRATSDKKRLAKEAGRFLCDHGYRRKSDNKHLRFEAREGFHGLGSLTLAKTPGESRGLDNARHQIARALGLDLFGKLR